MRAPRKGGQHIRHYVIADHVCTGTDAAARGEASEDVAWALRLAVNHDGDSDSTGSLTGQLLGARFGVEGLPARWVARVELRDIITTVADDLVTEHEDGDRWWGRYPGF